jgi:septum formation protein
VTRLVLGSASPGRLQVLRQAGIEPVVVVSGVDEDAVMAKLGSCAGPEQVTAALASAKAERVVGLVEPSVAADCVVIGCDSMLYIDGTLRGKPQSVAQARRQWESMAGRSGQLYTGHSLIRLRDSTIVHRCSEVEVTTVHFGVPSANDLNAYLATGEPLRVAGGFTLDGFGGWFVDRVDGDPSSVVGISLPMTRRLLGGAGLSVSQLWATNPVA